MLNLDLRFDASTVEAPEELSTQGGRGEGWRVTVYDNDSNTYEQVITILMIATGCDLDEAYMEAWEVDHLGRSHVHFAGHDDCTRVAEIIATIGIRVEVEKED